MMGPVTATITPPKTSGPAVTTSPSGTIVNVTPITRPNIVSGMVTTNAIQASTTPSSVESVAGVNPAPSETPAQSMAGSDNHVSPTLLVSPTSSQVTSNSSTLKTETPQTGVITMVNANNNSLSSSVVNKIEPNASTIVQASSQVPPTNDKQAITMPSSTSQVIVRPMGATTIVTSNNIATSSPQLVVHPSSLPGTPIRPTTTGAGTSANSSPARIVLSANDSSPVILQTSSSPGTPGGQVISTASGTIMVNRPVGQQVLVSNPNSLQQQFVLVRTPSGQIQQVAISPQAPGTSNLQRTLAPRALMNGPVRLQQSIQQRPGAPQQPLQPGLMGTQQQRGFLIRAPDGSFQLVQLAAPLQQGQPMRVSVPVSSASGIRPQGMTVNLTPNRATIRQQMPSQTGPPVQLSSSSSQIVNQSLQHQIQQPSQQVSLGQQPLVVNTTQANAQASVGAPGQMSPNTAKRKCKNFLSTLIKLANDQPEHVATNVRRLIQGLIDGVTPPEDFTEQLQRELKSSPQPCLVPFLKKSLPYLRTSLATGELSIEGVNAPSRASVPGPVVMSHPHLPYAFAATRPGGPMRFVQTQGGVVPLQSPLQTVTIVRPGGPQVQSPQIPHPAATPPSPATTPKPTPTKSAAKKRKPPTSAGGPKDKEKKISSHLREDDDINDVAAMGGVNLQEESQRMAAVANEVGTQIRSCKDEQFFFTSVLNNRVNRIASRFCLEECPPDVVSLISHAAQEKLKMIVERLGIIAEHRLENLKLNPKYEVTQDVRAQVKFLEELDKLEKKRHEEQEREMLLRAAKSRSKLEDPEQLKLKQKAKEMQRAELEEARQREANETALLAIGPRKKFRPDNPTGSPSSATSNPGSSIMLNNTTNNHHFSNSVFNSPLSAGSSKLSIRRMKRVNMKDLVFLMEQDKSTSKSSLLYKTYIKQ